ncbi:MAG: sigma-70 family RNA polymerase sigma factor [Thermodesulfobacteriota bacterium]|nr:sigma-70 family RNA polymerase sigma factor [Thermodesulfobacteriota bacterium]
MRRKGYKRAVKEKEDFLIGDEELLSSSDDKLTIIDSFTDTNAFSKEKSIDFLKEDYELYKTEIEDLDNFELEEDKKEPDYTLEDIRGEDDYIKIYFHEMGKISLLSAEEEIEIGERIEKKEEIFRNLLINCPILKKEYPKLYLDLINTELNSKIIFQSNATKRHILSIINKLNKIVNEGEYIYNSRYKNQYNLNFHKIKSFKLAIIQIDKQLKKEKDKLIQANLRLVINIAKRYCYRGLALLDLVQEGNIGLIKASDKFDFRRGYRFSTYASWWIMQAITRAISDQGQTIRTPVHMIDTLNRLKKVSYQLFQEKGRKPTIYEIAQAMKLNMKKIQEIISLAERRTYSLETPLNDDDNRLGNFIEDTKDTPPIEVVGQVELSEKIRGILNTLTPREEKIIRLRFGIDESSDHTLEEIAKKFHLTRERIRQIEAKALNKLKHPVRRKTLDDILDLN